MPETDIPETPTHRYQIEWFKPGLGIKYEYCDEDDIERRVTELEESEDYYVQEVAPVPLPTTDGSPNLID